MERLFLWILVITSEALVSGGDGACSFPREWRGRWYQNGLQDLEIHKHTISIYGECKEESDDKYLIYDRKKGCHMCLLIMRRHKNILQYKHSHCDESSDDLQTVCGFLYTDSAHLYTMVREPATPVRCPFQDAHHITYKNNTSGNQFCDNIDSRVRPCAGDAHLRFHYRKCEEFKYTFNQEMDLECLATWKDGSDQYMYGKFNAHWLTDKDKMYRCFIYKSYINLVKLAMSADATCMGMHSPTDGPVTMELKRDSSNWPIPMCSFPSWLMYQSWRDLSGRHSFYSEMRRGQELWMGHSKHRGHTIQTREAYRCRTDLGEDRMGGDDSFVSTSFTSHGCSSQYQCMRATRKREGLVELEFGPMNKSEPDRCPDRIFSNSSKYLIIPKVGDLVTCPLDGRYKTVKASSCNIEVLARCNHSAEIQLAISCQNKEREVVSLECLQTWNSGGDQFLMVQEAGVTGKPAHCFKITRIRRIIQITLDPSCNRGASRLPYDIRSLRLHKKPERCQVQQEPESPLRNDNTPDIRNGQHGNGVHPKNPDTSNSPKSNTHLSTSQKQGTRTPQYEVKSDDNTQSGCGIPTALSTVHVIAVLAAYWLSAQLR